VLRYLVILALWAFAGCTSIPPDAACKLVRFRIHTGGGQLEPMCIKVCGWVDGTATVYDATIVSCDEK